MSEINIGITFIAGILSFLSPCVLPLIPGYISFISGLSLEELKQSSHKSAVTYRAGLSAIFFVIGFSLTFILLGAGASFFGKFLFGYLKILTKIAGIFVIILGMHLLGILRIKLFNVEKRFKIDAFIKKDYQNKTQFLSRPASAMAAGFAFAFGWTPCVGAVLAGVLTLVAKEKTVIEGIWLLTVYSLGLGLPFILTGFAVGGFIRFFQHYKRFIRLGEIISGLLLIIIGMLIFFDNLAVLLRFIPSYFRKFAR